MKRLLAAWERRYARATKARNAKNHQPINRPSVTTRRATR